MRRTIRAAMFGVFGATALVVAAACDSVNTVQPTPTPTGSGTITPTPSGTGTTPTPVPSGAPGTIRVEANCLVSTCPATGNLVSQILDCTNNAILASTSNLNVSLPNDTVVATNDFIVFIPNGGGIACVKSWLDVNKNGSLDSGDLRSFLTTNTVPVQPSQVNPTTFLFSQTQP